MEEDVARTYHFMNVRDLIDTAFGDLEGNSVNFKLIQTILYLIARQLRILERHVEVSLPRGVPDTQSSSFKVTEIKITAKKSVDETAQAGKRKSIETIKDAKGKKKKAGEDDIPDSKKTSKRSSLTAQSADPQSLEEYVNMREKELRVIHQRADSHEQPDETPKPMSSMDDVHYEKLLVVERVPEKRLKDDQSPKISVVTHEEFVKLENIVNELRAQFAPIGTAKFPQNSQLMDELRKDASLTDAMAALQLSARLEATEKVLARMMEIVTTVVATAGAGTRQTSTTSKKFSKNALSATSKQGKKSQKPPPPAQVDELEEIGDRITVIDLQAALEKLNKNIIKKATDITAESIKVANDAFKLASNIETRLAAASNVEPRMVALENQIAVYAEQINIIDTGLTSQVTNYQEQLTQMQHELEIGLEAMNEALANAQGGDTVAVAELNNNFINLQIDYEHMTYRQKALQESHKYMTDDLTDLWEQIEKLRDTKSDRDEVADALRDKAGIRDLNGIVSVEQFDAVRGDLEKRIAASYDKFNNQEVVWQKAIDELLRELSEKADLIQVQCLKDEIAKYLTALKSRMDFMSNILGEPGAAATNKKVFRDTPCLCCSSPANMDVEEPAKPPALPKAIERKKPGGEIKPDSESKGDGDHRLCYPGAPIPHPPHPRSHYCHRYCGGSHTILSTGPPKVPPDTTITQLPRKEIKKPEPDEKDQRVPCIPCQKPLTPKKPAPAPVKEVKKPDIPDSPTKETSVKEAATGSLAPTTSMENVSQPSIPDSAAIEPVKLISIMVQHGTAHESKSTPAIDKSVTIVPM